MAIIDIVKYEQQEGVIVHKFPSCDLRWGTQLVVYPGQIAFFVKGGKVCDKFTDGTYTLKTKNIPLLNKIINIPFGNDSPFQADVWFVNTLQRLSLKWGTETPINLALEKARKEVEAVHNRLSSLQGEMKQITLAIGECQEQYKKIEFPEQLPEIIKKQQEENLNTERTFSTMEARLLQQEKNKLTVEQIAKELAEKQTIAERWAKLNKLIGSADGAKFKVIAQSYTLNLLLLHANKHLSYLSKRYKLQQVPDTLALQVIDCDMCDEIRTVYSLSGGESFLISLALALGLSSLSSNNLKVESLFIDEGFGSLDAESLRTAMEALEQLQMQGRKIGVISHVQEMSERISVQVQVHKKVNGKSVLTVAG